MSYLQELGLEPETVLAKIQFLVWRADAHRTQAERSESPDRWARTALVGAAASNMAQAASLTFLTKDPDINLLQRASMDYLKAQLPYGLLLDSLCSQDEQAYDGAITNMAAQWLSQVDDSYRKDEETSPDAMIQERLPGELSSINQQLYLAAALISSSEMADRYYEPLKSLLARLRSHSNMPHGPQGQPLAVYLDIYEPLLDYMKRPYQDTQLSLEALKRLMTRHSESIESAMRNAYLWKNICSPVEYLDLEIVFAAKSMAHRFELQLDEVLDSENTSSIPIRIAMSLSRTLRPSPFKL
jgi:hypothetical protein